VLNDANNLKRVCLIRGYVCCADICCGFFILSVYGLRMRVPRMEGNEDYVDTPTLE
jgi:hypothetical protein